MKKKKVLFHTDFSLVNTGFGKNAKNVLTYLYKTGKYDLVHYCCGAVTESPDLLRTPWKSIGSVPANQQDVNNYLNSLPPEQREAKMRTAGYGELLMDKTIQEEKPDVYIGIQDIWGVDYNIDRFWFPKIHSVIWTTLDSLPILPSAVEKAKEIKNYWIWSNFATKELHRLGYPHVKTMHGAIDASHFYRLSDKQRGTLRKIFSIEQDAFVVGFVFRNQLRKSVPNLLEGYKLWKERNGVTKKSYLLLHTHFGEGWNIHRLAEEAGVNKDEILTTHVCQNCRNYEVKVFKGQGQDCRFCGAKQSQTTTSVGFGVTEDQLNEVYNLMDIYCHPFTSGGQEIPIQEAKLTELITLVTNYSCGEEACEEAAHSFPLDWAEYREHGTEFRKASTSPASISKQLDKVYRMDPKDRLKMGKAARQWIIDNFSVESVGKQIEAFLDALPEVNFDFVKRPPETKDPNAQVENIEDNTKWLIHIYDKILKMKVDEKDSGVLHWLHQFKSGMPKQQIEAYFRKVAFDENNKNTKVEFTDLLGKDDAGKRILFIIPESIGDVFICTSLFKSLKNQYPWANLYVATKPEYHEILDGNPYVYKVLPYMPQMDNQIWLEGAWNHEGFFELSFHPYFGTQRMLDYLNNGKTNIAFNLKSLPEFIPCSG
jgi:glycosyltransferase involved in cell wall biosynthesis